jgi:hypothetical protein
MKISDVEISSLLFTEGSAPSTPASGFGRLYVRTTGLHFMGDDGVEIGPLSTGGGGSVSDIVYGAGWNGDTTTAPSKNAVYDKVEALSTYADYTPTFTQSGALTTSTLVSRWVQVGKHVHFVGRCVFSNAGTTNNAIRMTLPTATTAGLGGSGDLGTFSFTDSGTALYQGVVLAASTTTVDLYASHLTAGAVLGQGPNFAVANNDQFRWNITYEAA